MSVRLEDVLFPDDEHTDTIVVLNDGGLWFVIECAQFESEEAANEYADMLALAHGGEVDTILH